MLGDDIVIADKAVATNYLALMEFLGVDINLFKSLESEIGVAEFAKRLLTSEGDLSPASPRLLLSVARNPRHLVEAIRDLYNRGTSIQLPDLKRFVDGVPGSKRLGPDFI